MIATAFIRMRVPPAKTRILIADDHSIVRLGLSALFSYERDMQVVGEAEDGAEAVQLARERHPDVVVMDLMMPGTDGVEATRLIRAGTPETRVLILTTFGTSADVARAVEAGASGAIMKDASNEDLLAAIRKVATGGTAFSPEIEESVRDDINATRFTQRQLDILHSVTRGLTNAEIAIQFGISLDGVKRHCMTIFKKLGAANRSEAVAIAIRKHLVKG